MRDAGGVHICEPDPVEREADRIGGGAVDAHHPPLDRAVIAEIQNRTGEVMGAARRQQQAAGDEGQAEPERPEPVAPTPCPEKTRESQTCHAEETKRRGLLRQGEIERDAKPQHDRGPRHQRAALAVQEEDARRGNPGMP